MSALVNELSKVKQFGRVADSILRHNGKNTEMEELNRDLRFIRPGFLVGIYLADLALIDFTPTPYLNLIFDKTLSEVAKHESA